MLRLHYKCMDACLKMSNDRNDSERVLLLTFRLVVCWFALRLGRCTLAGALIIRV